MRFIGGKKWQAQQELRGSLAAEDPQLRNIAGLIDMDHIMDTGRREEAFKRLATVSERYCLDPMTVSAIIQDMYPDLKDIIPPPHEELTRVSG